MPAYAPFGPTAPDESSNRVKIFPSTFLARVVA